MPISKRMDLYIFEKLNVENSGPCLIRTVWELKNFEPHEVILALEVFPGQSIILMEIVFICLRVFFVSDPYAYCRCVEYTYTGIETLAPDDPLVIS